MAHTRRMRGSERLDHDVIHVLTRPCIAGTFWVDLEPARAWLEARDASERLTWTHLIVKAAALAALQAPELHRMYGWGRALDPAHADVGVSVLGERIVTPVVVVRAADTLSPGQIRDVLRQAVPQAQAEERAGTALVDRWWWVVPLAWVRRRLTRLVLSFPGVRRKLVGTIQVSNIGFFGFEHAHVPMVGELLLVTGAVEKRVVAGDDDLPLARLGMVCSIHASHTKLNGETGGRFVRAFRELLAHPDRLA